MKIIKTNWYGLDQEKVCKLLGDNVTYVNDFCVNGEYKPVSVYHSKNPDRSKGHKDYVLLRMDHDLIPSSNKKLMVIRGMDKEEMEKWRYQNAVYCVACKELIYSVMRHDYKHCSCEKVMVDGGRDYTRTNAGNVIVKFDLLNDKIV